MRKKLATFVQCLLDIEAFLVPSLNVRIDGGLGGALYITLQLLLSLELGFCKCTGFPPHKSSRSITAGKGGLKKVGNRTEPRGQEDSEGVHSIHGR